MAAWDPNTFDPVNDSADSIYAQIRSLAVEVKALNGQIESQSTSLAGITSTRDTKLAQLIALRDQIQVELTGIPVQS